MIGLSPRSAAGMVSRIDEILGGRSAIDLLRLAGRQRARALVVHDPEDREVPFADARALANAWPGASLLSLSGAGHTRALRHPEVISRAVGFVADPGSPLALSA
jgi:pimeloyl-ACP methyl ester carboxylesterase